MEIKNLTGKKVAILGLGVEGVALTEFLLPLGCKITVCDKMNQAELLAGAEGDFGGVVRSRAPDGSERHQAAEDRAVFLAGA